MCELAAPVPRAVRQYYREHPAYADALATLSAAITGRDPGEERGFAEVEDDEAAVFAAAARVGPLPLPVHWDDLVPPPSFYTKNDVNNSNNLNNSNNSINLNNSGDGGDAAADCVYRECWALVRVGERYHKRTGPASHSYHSHRQAVPAAKTRAYEAALDAHDRRRYPRGPREGSLEAAMAARAQNTNSTGTTPGNVGGSASARATLGADAWDGQRAAPSAAMLRLQLAVVNTHVGSGIGTGGLGTVPGAVGSPGPGGAALVPQRRTPWTMLEHFSSLRCVSLAEALFNSRVEHVVSAMAAEGLDVVSVIGPTAMAAALSRGNYGNNSNGDGESGYDEYGNYNAYGHNGYGGPNNAHGNTDVCVKQEQTQHRSHQQHQQQQHQQD